MKLQELLRVMETDPNPMKVKTCAAAGGVETRIAEPAFWLCNCKYLCDMEVRSVKAEDGMVVAYVGDNWL